VAVPKLSKTLTNSVAPEPEGSSPHSRQSTDSPYPEPGESTQHPSAKLRKAHFDPILPSTPWSFQWSFLRAFPPKSCTRSYPLTCVPHGLPISFSSIWSA
jgi:hypothetical protein